MAARITRELYLQLGADPGNLKTQMAAARTVVLNYGTTAIDVMSEVQKAVNDFSADGISRTTKQIDADFRRMFQQIRANAQAVSDAPSGKIAFDLVDAAATEQAAAKQRNLADAYRMIVAGAQEAKAATDAEARANRELAISFANAALEAERQATALEMRAGVLRGVQAGVASGPAGATLAAIDAERLAQESAQRAQEAAAAQALLEQRNRSLLASIDPLYAAQQRYNVTMVEANALREAGVLTAQRFAQVEQTAAESLREVADAAGVAAEKQQALYVQQAASARVEAAGNRYQDLIAATEEVRLANLSAAESYRVFEEQGVFAAEKLQSEYAALARSAREQIVGDRFQGLIEETNKVSLANKSAAESYAVFSQAGMISDRSVGQQRQGMMQLSEQARQFFTEVELGIDPITAFTQQSGQAAYALQFFEGKLGAAGEFLASFAGTALLVAVTMLASFVAEQIKANNAVDEAVDKLKKDAAQTETTREAKERFKNTAEGVAAAIREGTDATKKAIEAEKSAAEQANLTAKANLEKEVSIRKATAAALEAAIAQERIDKQRAGAPGQRGELGALADAESSNRVAGLQAQLAQNNALISEAQSRYSETQIELAKETAKQMTDPILRITKLYEKQANAAQDAARAAAKANGNVITPAQQDALTARLAQIDRERDAAIKAEQQRKSGRDPNRQFGRDIDLSQAEDIVRGIGGRITSALRSTADQAALYADKLAGRHDGPVAKPGTSAHERGNALDVAYGPGISVASIKEAFAKEGVALRKVLDEPGQRVFHVEWGKAGPSAEQQARAQQAAADKARNNAAEYGNLLSRAQEEQLALLDKQTSDLVTSAQYAARDVEAEQAHLDAAARKGVADRKWSQAQADALVMLNAQNAGMKIDAISQKLVHDQLQQQLDAEKTVLESRAQSLGLDLRIAKTRQQQLDLELQLLAIQEEIVKREAAKVIADPTSTAKDKIAAEGRIAAVDDQHGRNVQLIQDQHADPIQSYRDGLVKNVGDMDDALKGVEANGLKGLEDGLTGIITGTESVASAFKKMATSIIADLVRIGVEKLILSFIGFKDGNVPGFAAGRVPGFADGIISGPGTGTSDSIPAWMEGFGAIRVANGESIINAESTRRYRPVLKAINEGRFPGFAAGLVPPGQIYMRPLPSMSSIQRTPVSAAPIVFDMRNAVVTSELLQQVHAISAQYAQVSIVTGSQMAQQESAEAATQRIPV